MLRGRKRSKLARNHFTISLLRKIFCYEAELIFSAGRDGFVKYLTIPREEQKSITDVRSYKARLSLAEYHTVFNRADSTVTWVIDKKGLYEYSDEMLDRVVSRITFFHRFNSFKEFEEHYHSFANEYTRWIETPVREIPIDIRKDLVRKVSNTFRSDHTFLKHSFNFYNGKRDNKFIRLTSGYALYHAQDSECWLFNCAQILEASVKFEFSLNARPEICMYEHGQYIQVEIPRKSTLYKAVLITDLYAINQKVRYTILRHLPTILKKYGVSEKVNILIVCDDNDFRIGPLLGFKKVNRLSESTSRQENGRYLEHPICYEERVFEVKISTLISLTHDDSLGFKLY